MADTQERRCPNCNAVLTQATRHNGKRIWCSQRCRRIVQHARRKDQPGWWKVRKCWLCSKKGGGGSGMVGKRSFCSEECRQITKDCERSELVPRSGLTGLVWHDINKRDLGSYHERYAFYSALATRLRWLLPRCCVDCKKQHTYFGNLSKRRCDACAEDRERSSRHKIAAKRRGAVAGHTVSRRLIYERDQGTCWICSRKVQRWEEWQGISSRRQARLDFLPTLDHLRPLAKGGEHSAQNIRLAHFICNARRGHMKSRAQTVRAILG